MHAYQATFLAHEVRATRMYGLLWKRVMERVHLIAVRSVCALLRWVLSGDFKEDPKRRWEGNIRGAGEPGGVVQLAVFARPDAIPKYDDFKVKTWFAISCNCPASSKARWGSLLNSRGVVLKWPFPFTIPFMKWPLLASGRLQTDFGRLQTGRWSWSFSLSLLHKWYAFPSTLKLHQHPDTTISTYNDSAVQHFQDTTMPKYYNPKAEQLQNTHKNRIQ